MIETQTIVVRPDGSVTIPDLTDELSVTAKALGGANHDPRPSLLGGPRLAIAKHIMLPLPVPPEAMSEELLWRWHARGAAEYRLRFSPPFQGGDQGEDAAERVPPSRATTAQYPSPRHDEGEAKHASLHPPLNPLLGKEGRGHHTSWLRIKQTLARRLLGLGCRLCARRCRIDRAAGEVGFCGLGADLRLTAPVRLWGEEPELGRPGLGLMTAGCGLRCRFCYRPENLDARTGETADPGTVAGWIDAADDVEHVHFLGGNPDESLPGILDVLTQVRIDRPVVWNTHSHLTAAQALLLEGVVDGFVADLKFGPGECAAEITGIPDYWANATATLQRLARFDSTLLVRHVALPGHLDCCAGPVARWLRAALPNATVHLLDQYEPLHRAAGDASIGRRLSESEQARLAALANGPGGKDG